MNTTPTPHRDETVNMLKQVIINYPESMIPKFPHMTVLLYMCFPFQSGSCVLPAIQGKASIIKGKCDSEFDLSDAAEWLYQWI